MSSVGLDDDPAIVPSTTPDGERVAVPVVDLDLGLRRHGEVVEEPRPDDDDPVTGRDGRVGLDLDLRQVQTFPLTPERDGDVVAQVSTGQLVGGDVQGGAHAFLQVAGKTWPSDR
jgi:hypothetical protein